MPATSMVSTTRRSGLRTQVSQTQWSQHFGRAGATLYTCRAQYLSSSSMMGWPPPSLPLARQWAQYNSVASVQSGVGWSPTWLRPLCVLIRRAAKTLQISPQEKWHQWCSPSFQRSSLTCLLQQWLLTRLWAVGVARWQSLRAATRHLWTSFCTAALSPVVIHIQLPFRMWCRLVCQLTSVCACVCSYHVAVCDLNTCCVSWLSVAVRFGIRLCTKGSKLPSMRTSCLRFEQVVLVRLHCRWHVVAQDSGSFDTACKH
mmetsp:Transcript_104636/g.207809  ORF Transcript_104636/g.207809 Transcript_104636/m.207809 type:complete len:258 (+) Transcript_104636:459-1232(+)